MKKAFSFAIILVAAAIAVAVVSCKKDTQNAISNPKNQSAQAFDPSHITDMNAYLKDFKKKMQTSAERKDGESLSIEEAAWHLSSVANYDFANANAQFTDIRFDTLRYHLDVTNGMVSMTNLDEVYDEIYEDLDAFYHSLNLENKHFRFIDASVSEEGEVTICMSITYLILDHVWYFPDEFLSDTVCYYYFSEDSVYVWDELGLRELVRRMNLLEGHTWYNNDPDNGCAYYTKTRQNTFHFRNYIDPYGSPFCRSSRLFAVASNLNYVIPLEEMCYCVDSYLGLGYQYMNDNFYVNGESPVEWIVERKYQAYPSDYYWTCHHELTVIYGQYHEAHIQIEH